MPLDADQGLRPLMATRNALRVREDELRGEQAEFRNAVPMLSKAFELAAEAQGDATGDVGSVSYASPEALLSVARVLGN
jgi:hypothetical protein